MIEGKAIFSWNSILLFQSWTAAWFLTGDGRWCQEKYQFLVLQIFPGPTYKIQGGGGSIGERQRKTVSSHSREVDIRSEQEDWALYVAAWG